MARRSPRPAPAPEPLSDLVAELAGMASVDASEIAAVMERAILFTYQRLRGEDPAVRVRLDLATGSHRLVRVEDGEETPLPPLQGDEARQAAQAVRAAVAERLRSAGVDRIITEAAERRGELIDAVVEGRAGAVWQLRAGDTTVLLPPEEQAAGEELEPRRHLKVVVLEGRRRARDAVLVASRSHPLLLRLLLEQEVPELQSGQVVIREIAREAGRRSKVAVEATDPDIDPQGACIGPRGIRHRAVTQELGQEQLQIVLHSDEPAEFVANALSPARVHAVELDPATRTAHVTVDPDQLSLAIGRKGENARLAARLTGWRIDIAAADA